MQELIDLLGKDNVREVEVERGLFGRGRVRVATGPAESTSPQTVVVQSEAAQTPAAAAQPEQTAATDATGPDTGNLHTVASPLVGLFYRAPAPDAPPFVEEGDIVEAGQTLCVVETMKIMNEIESDVAGRVARTLVENGQPVEYNTPLFLIEPQ